MQAVLIRAGLEELTEALLQFELVDACPVGEDGNVNVVDGIFFNEGFGQFDCGDVVEFGTLDGVGVTVDSLLAHGDKV